MLFVVVKGFWVKGAEGLVTFFNVWNILGTLELWARSLARHTLKRVTSPSNFLSAKRKTPLFPFSILLSTRRLLLQVNQDFTIEPFKPRKHGPRSDKEKTHAYHRLGKNGCWQILLKKVQEEPQSLNDFPAQFGLLPCLSFRRRKTLH